MNKDLLQVVFGALRPTTIAAIIADLDGQPIDTMSYSEIYTMQFAINTLFANAGAEDAIAMLAKLEVNAGNPLVADAVDEWTEAQP